MRNENQHPRRRPFRERQPRPEPTLTMQDYIEKMIKAEGAERLELAREMSKKGREAISAVDRLLTSRDRRLRLIAAMVLSHARHHDAVPGLIHALADTDATVRLQAAAGLGRYSRSNARKALWQAFPDRNSAVSVAILRSMGKIMTAEMAAGLRDLDSSTYPPVVQKELAGLLAEKELPRKAAVASPPTRQLPLMSAPWLRMLPGRQCRGTATIGTEEIAATYLRWQLPEAEVTKLVTGEVHFRLPDNLLPRLVQTRVLRSVWVALPRNTETDLAEDEKVINPLYAFAHAKGLQSIVAYGDTKNSAIRPLARALGLRTANAPGNPRSLRVQPEPKSVWVEYLAETDYPTLRTSSSTSRTIAACLCALTVGSDRDAFLDPFCADGQVIIERGLLGTGAQLHGMEMSSERLQQAEQNWRIMAPTTGYAANAASLELWNSNQIAAEAASIDAVATAIGGERLSDLKVTHFSEVARVLRAKRKAAFFTADPELLQKLLAEAGFVILLTQEVGQPTLGHLVLATRA